MRLPLLCLLLLVTAALTVDAGHLALSAFVQPRDAHVRIQRMLAAVSLQSDDPIDSCMSGLKDLGDFDVEKMLMNVGVSAGCRTMLNTSTPDSVNTAQQALEVGRQKQKSADCSQGTKTNTSDISSCTTTYVYVQAQKSTFKSTIEALSPAWRMVAMDMSTSFKLSISYSVPGQSSSMYMSKQSTDKGQIMAFPQACSNADLGQLSAALNALGVKMDAMFKALGPCVSLAFAAMQGTGSVSVSGSVAMALYPDFDASMNPVESSKISASHYSGALPTYAGGSFLVATLLAGAAAVLARKLF